jgi:hypothetical protein
VARAISKLAPGWWTTPPRLGDFERRGEADGQRPGAAVRPGFSVSIYDTVEEFTPRRGVRVREEAATADNPVGGAGRSARPSSCRSWRAS